MSISPPSLLPAAVVRFTALLRAVALAAVLSAALAPAGVEAQQAGQHYVFRTLDTGNPPTPEQDAFCDTSFGFRAATVVSRLRAVLYSFRVDPASGRLADQTANELGPGFICLAPGGGGLDAFAYTDLPATGRVDLEGECGLRPIVVAPGALSVPCALSARASAAVAGGLATSNSIANSGPAPLPTGSVWTAYVAGESTPVPPGGTSPSPPQDNVPGLDFFVLREGASTFPPSHPGCPAATRPRVARLHAVQPDLGSGLVPAEAGPDVGELLACTTDGGVLVARITLPAGHGATHQIAALGTCDEHPVAATAETVRRCALSVVPRGPVRDGSVTSNGVVDPVAPDRPAAPAIWTISLLG